MNSTGGEENKLGNRYEGIWTVDVLLDVLDGGYEWIEVEPLDDPIGIEFKAIKLGNLTEWHSVKRQAVNEWSLAKLTKPDRATGRSVLGDLIRRVTESQCDRAVFVSSTGANVLRDLSEEAATRDSIEDFQKRSVTFRDKFSDLVERLSTDQDSAFHFLKHLRVVLMDEAELIRRVEQKAAKLVYRPDGLPVDDADVRLQLAEYVVTNLGNKLDRQRITEALASVGYQLADWTSKSGIPARVNSENRRYQKRIESDWIDERFISRPQVDEAFQALTDPAGSPCVIVEGAAGVGKSCVVSRLLSRLQEAGIPHLVVRMDDAVSLTTTREFGQKLHSLSQSPAVVLAGVADGRRSVLVVDQVDAVSEYSGRDHRLFDLFAALAHEAESYPNMRLLLSCRTVDLEHDHRLRKLSSKKGQVRRVKVERLTEQQVNDVLVSVGVEPGTMTSPLRDVLRTPIHLRLFVETLADSGTAFRSCIDLFDRYWDFKRRQVASTLGREPRWTEVIFRLVESLNDRRQLSARAEIFDQGDLIGDAQAMASGNVLVTEGRHFRFFHETFFDYCAARRLFKFRLPGSSLVDWLLSQGEQELSRRANVRQALQYGRERNFDAYLADVRELLADARVRFHLKSMVVNWLGTLESPTLVEWRLLKPFLEDENLRGRLLVAMRPNLGWFDVLDSDGVLVEWLNSSDSKDINTATWLMTNDLVLKQRSPRVAELFEPFVGRNSDWRSRLHGVVSWGQVHHSRRMFDLFLRLVDDGTVAECPADSDRDYWMCFYKVSKERPDLAAEALGHWFDTLPQDFDSEDPRSPLSDLSHSQTGEMIIRETAEKAPQRFVEEILPRVVRLASKFRLPRNSTVAPDKAFGPMSNSTFGLDGALLDGTRKSLEHFARSDPGFVSPILEQLAEQPLAICASLVMRAWSENPEQFADRCVQFILASTDRLNFGYGSWGGGGNGHAAITRETLTKVSPYCSATNFESLETAILNYRFDEEDEWNERYRYLLLTSLAPHRLSQPTRRELERLRQEYPTVDTTIPEDDDFGMDEVESPITDQRAEAMSDDEWLAAMKQHRDDEDELRSRFGGARQLSSQLGNLVRRQKERFAALAERMSDDLSPLYFSAILDGMIGRWMNLSKEEKEKNEAELSAIDTKVFETLVQRLHRLPDRPCGRSICGLFEHLAERAFSEAALMTLAWYAINDLDPTRETWATKSQSGALYYDGDPYGHGINTNRGNAARAIRALLFADYTRRPILDEALRVLVRDRSVAVRSCVIECLYPVWNHDRDEAVALFLEAVEQTPDVWPTPHWEQFIHYAVRTHYEKLRPMLVAALSSPNDKVAKAAARQICIAQLTSDSTAELDQLMTGGEAARLGVADVASANLKDADVGGICADLLRTLFFDSSDKVRGEASTCFWKADSDLLVRSQDLIAVFIESPAFGLNRNPLLDALEESHAPMPEITIRSLERFMASATAETGHVANASAIDAGHVAKLVFRLYEQSTSQDTCKRCLDMIDRMEELRFYGIESELKLVDA